MSFISGYAQTGAAGSPSNGGRTLGLSTYPSPWIDPSSRAMPPSNKELMRWAQYAFTTNPIISSISRKKASYAITELVYSGNEDYHAGNSAAIWRETLEKFLHVPEFEFELLLDYEVYGNAFASIAFPFERKFTCPKCKTEVLARNADWRFEGGKFIVACEPCHEEKTMAAEDQYISSREKIRLLRWFPKYMEVDYNPFSGDSVYVYQIPKHVRAKVLDHTKGRNRDIVSTTPLTILRTIAKKANLRINADNIYHMKNSSISTEDESFGMPPIVSVFKALWLYQTLQKAQEAIALDHVLPMTLVSPAGGGSGQSPHENIDLSQWSSRFENLIRKWRRDPNGIFAVPFPAMVENVRGDAQALSMHNEMTTLLQTISGGLDVPSEFVLGGTLSYSGSSVSLRVLENLFIKRKNQLDRFLREFLVPKLRAVASLPKIDIRHRDFKMADDAQQKQIALGLRQTNTISDQTTIEELGFDHEKERMRRKAEAIERLEEMELQQIRTASIQGQVQVIQGKYAALAQAEQMSTASGGEDKPKALTGNVEDLDDFGDPRMLDLIAHNFLKTRDPGSRAQELKQMATTNPERARAIRDRIKMINKQVEENKPLPEQRPPRSAKAGI